MNLKKQQGFTLIELMIVIAIIAVLAAIALPAYADYLKRTKVSEAIVNVSASRTGIAEFVASYGHLPAAASYTPDGTSTQYVAAGTSWNGAAITATVQNIPNVAGTITLTPSQVASSVVKVWTCSGTVPSKYRPATCQG